MKRLFLFLLALVLAFSGLSVLSAAPLPPLHIDGLTFAREDGTRFVINGINLEAYRDYDGGCGWVSDGSWTSRVDFAKRLRALNINVVRLNYSYRFLNNAQNFARYMDIAEALTAQQLYIMPSDHTYTGGVLSSASASYPMMGKIWDEAKRRGIENYFVMNPWNEPGPDVTVSQWVQAQKDVLTYLRNTAGFNGIVVLDGTGWSTLLNVSAFQQVQAFDKWLRGSANVAFSNHLYPNISSLPAQIWTAAKQVPLVIGELGQENPGSSALDPGYVKSVISGALSTGIPNGHNGLFAWIWAWCDTNKMLEDWEDPSIPYTANSKLTSHGVLWRDNYFNKSPVGTLPTLVPTTTLVASPTFTPTATYTPSVRPTTVAPSATPAKSKTPVGGTATPTCLTFTSREGKILTICV